jgi:hypothetical protein
LAKFSQKNVEFLNGQKAIFGSNDESYLTWDAAGNQLLVSTVVSGVEPTAPGHLTPRFYVDSAIATISGASQEFLDIYDAGGGQDISSGWTDIQFDTIRQKTGAFTFTADGTEVTITASGTYVVSYRLTTDDTAGDRISTYGRLQIDTGSGYTTVPGSWFAMYQADGEVSESSSTATLILNLNKDDKLKVQADGSSASSTSDTIAEGCSLVIFNAGGLQGDAGTIGEDGDKGDTGFGLWAFGRVESDGTELDTFNLNVSRTATGTYACTFDTDPDDANYGIHVQPYQTVTDTNAMVSSVSSTGFTITIGQGDNGGTPDTLADTDFSVAVYHSNGSPTVSGSNISFLDLKDTPTTYSGSVGDYLRVTSSGIEFAEVNVVVDHGGLTGLDDDDHTQYLLADGSRQLSDDWNYGSANVSGTGSFYGNGATLSGIAYVDGDDVYFYDTTRSKDLGVAILEIGCGRNSANTTNQYLRTYNGTPMNQTGVALPWDATLIGGAAMGSSNTQTWTVRLRKNDSATNIASLTVTNAYENHVTNANIDFDEGDRIQIYMEGTNINYPQARLYFRRRK